MVLGERPLLYDAGGNRIGDTGIETEKLIASPDEIDRETFTLLFENNIIPSEQLEPYNIALLFGKLVPLLPLAPSVESLSHIPQADVDTLIGIMDDIIEQAGTVDSIKNTEAQAKLKAIIFQRIQSLRNNTEYRALLSWAMGKQVHALDKKGATDASLQEFEHVRDIVGFDPSYTPLSTIEEHTHRALFAFEEELTRSGCDPQDIERVIHSLGVSIYAAFRTIAKDEQTTYTRGSVDLATIQGGMPREDWQTLSDWIKKNKTLSRIIRGFDPSVHDDTSLLGQSPDDTTLQDVAVYNILHVALQETLESATEGENEAIRKRAQEQLSSWYGEDVRGTLVSAESLSWNIHVIELTKDIKDIHLKERLESLLDGLKEKMTHKNLVEQLQSVSELVTLLRTEQSLETQRRDTQLRARVKKKCTTAMSLAEKTLKKWTEEQPLERRIKHVLRFFNEPTKEEREEHLKTLTSATLPSIKDVFSAFFKEPHKKEGRAYSLREIIPDLTLKRYISLIHGAPPQFDTTQNVLKDMSMWNLAHLKIDNISLHNWSITNINLYRSSFTNCDMRVISLEGVNFLGTELNNSRFNIVDPHLPEWIRVGCNDDGIFTKSKLGETLRRGDHKITSLREIDLTNVDLRNADLRDIDYAFVRFTDKLIEGARFTPSAFMDNITQYLDKDGYYYKSIKTKK